MKMIARPLMLAIGVALILFGLFGVDAAPVACTPAQREAAAQIAPSVVRGACVVLHAAANDGTTDTICATAEELAPVVRTLLEDRNAEAPKASSALDPDASPARLALAVKLEPVAELPAPVRRVARRRCASWVAVASSSKDAAPTDAAHEAETGDR